MAEQYEKKELRQHIYDTPDTYVGGIDVISEVLPIKESDNITFKEIEYIPALLNIFNEILVNARDQIVRLQGSKGANIVQVSHIKIDYNDDGSITVLNDGNGIVVKEHEKEKIYIPQLIFGELLTSSNYKKGEKRIVGGKNGYGAKLANIFSQTFTIETVDHINSLKYTQTWEKNMTVCNKPSIKKCQGKPYTKITWKCDFGRFGIQKYSDEMIKLMYRRIYDIAGITDKSINVFLNGEKIKIKSFIDYINLYNDSTKYQEIVSDRWDVIFSVSHNDTFEQVSFVNGICTSKGGSHVECIAKQVCNGIIAFIKKQHKKEIKDKVVRRYISLYINCVIENPSFDSQTKERCITSQTKFGSKPVLSAKYIKKICSNNELIDKILDANSKNDNKDLKKTDGKKKNKIIVPKLDDANWAGTKKSDQCTLILTEGDSAKSMAIAGLSEVGRDKYGVFPLKGKVLNVREANVKQINANTEIVNIKKILGLESNKKYKDIKSLRYGKIMIMTDQDHDGFHIKGLLINMFHFLWPELLNFDFISYMITPIVKVSLKKTVIPFYTLTDYEEWKKKTSNANKYTIKYYKGLGTSTAAEAKQYFRELKVNDYNVTEQTDHAVNLAFKKTEADNRKEWLRGYDKKVILDYTVKKTNIDDFVNKELIHFSNSDNCRSIGSAVDGLKTSQRKILFSCFKRKLYTEIRVAQLSGYVSEHASYHHGEASLQGAIIAMAQDFVGSNNINLLQPNGQFGTRIMGGADAASPRYIHTQINPITDLIYKKDDFPLLKYIDDDGLLVEPEYYVPIIPMVLVNGMVGIGTGWSTSIPQYNPIDIINNIKRKITKGIYHAMNPFYKGFKGSIEKISDTQYISKGNYSLEEDRLVITELPVGEWTDKYIRFLEDSILSDKSDIVLDFDNYSTEKDISIKVKLSSDFIYNQKNFKVTNGVTEFEKRLKLTSSISLTNIHAYNSNNIIKKYKTPYEIMDEHNSVRSHFYHNRKEYILAELKNKLCILENKVRFIKEVISKNIKVAECTKDELLKQLFDKEYHLYDGNIISHITTFNKVKSGYDYLIKMPIYTMSKDKVNDLEEEHAKIVGEIEITSNKGVNTMWIEELDELLIYYKKNNIV
jgi:DNA topoisomerase-2